MTKKKTKKKPALTARELRKRLEAKYQKPEWVTVHEVSNSTGAGHSRSADTLAFSTWPSRGCNLYGFEIKSRRSDVLKELREPEKAEAVAKYCDRWYLVVGRKDLIAESEIPKKWGLLVPHGNGLRIAKEAPLNEDVLPWPRTFVASMVRNAFWNVPDQEAAQEQFEKGKKAGLDHRSWELQRKTEDLQRIMDKLKRFEELTGCRGILERYGSERTLRSEAEVIRTVITSGAKDYFSRINEAVNELAEVSAKLRQNLTEKGVVKKAESLDDPCPIRKYGHVLVMPIAPDGKVKAKGSRKVYCSACGVRGTL